MLDKILTYPLTNGRALPFKDSALSGIIMVDVLHHIPDPARFFAEAERVLHPGGVIAMLEPWNSAWSHIVYKNLHGEPFVPEAASWRLADLPGTRGQGPLSAANGALPWILFQRDYRQFERTFPCLRLAKIELDYPLSGFRRHIPARPISRVEFQDMARFEKTAFPGHAPSDHVRSYHNTAR